MKILLSGYYGFHNTGDEAIALAITRELSTRGHSVNVLSATPEETARAFGVASAHRMRLLNVLKAVLSADVVLSGGGGLLQDRTSSRTLTYYLAVIRLARLLGKRTVVFNQSIGPLSPVGGKRVAAALRAVPAIVRDRLSLDTLSQLGVQARLGGDPALLLRASEGTRHENRVILAPRAGERGATERLAELARALRSAGREVVCLSFHPPHDDQEARLIGGEVISTSDPQTALDAIAGAGFVVGVRLHAVILAAAAGVPFAGVSYDPKVAGFCADAGALAVTTDFDPAWLGQEILAGRSVDWHAVGAMKQRAKDSFDWALAR
ncbi:polysaccharide pyruvyl transferase CsaB [Deinococcus peraridilitoris]|uniref:Polysaccharide pyruvyl transferase CsaB n=1 Tax=Deinococcus peraridilitoris (strain DSM 19664 / LMG 22246 / CIP 109416 / KR-200) TaxID=937777 RepID=K9ZYY2_DEIPD|nr:polysaccharide pyruvyl transferase CsaB [Deinococcus peraridilitoris]AFZ66414.1 polysaccharide pyruvyl transferase CsaB [Deinococcus peraridilitoris DSM 19664]